MKDSSYLDAESYIRNREDEDDFYDGGEIANLLEDDEISSEEEAFMRGYMGV